MRFMRILGNAILALLGTLLIAGCGGGEMSPGTTRFFLVAEKDAATHQDSYILPLSDPQDIAQARQIISNPAGAMNTIVVAKIARGSGDGAYLNKDLVGGRTWSWHVTQFEGFASSTIEILDGWPTYVEDNLDDWLAMTDSTIGFWSYTVTREVSLAELQ